MLARRSRTAWKADRPPRGGPNRAVRAADLHRHRMLSGPVGDRISGGINLMLRFPVPREVFRLLLRPPRGLHRRRTETVAYHRPSCPPTKMSDRRISSRG